MFVLHFWLLSSAKNISRSLKVNLRRALWIDGFCTGIQANGVVTVGAAAAFTLAVDPAFQTAKKKRLRHFNVTIGRADLRTTRCI